MYRRLYTYITEQIEYIYDTNTLFIARWKIIHIIYSIIHICYLSGITCFLFTKDKNYVVPESIRWRIFILMIVWKLDIILIDYYSGADMTQYIKIFIDIYACFRRRRNNTSRSTSRSTPNQISNLEANVYTSTNDIAIGISNNNRGNTYVVIVQP